MILRGQWNDAIFLELLVFSQKYAITTTNALKFTKRNGWTSVISISNIIYKFFIFNIHKAACIHKSGSMYVISIFMIVVNRYSLTQSMDRWMDFKTLKTK